MKWCLVQVFSTADVGDFQLTVLTSEPPNFRHWTVQAQHLDNCWSSPEVPRKQGLQYGSLSFSKEHTNHQKSFHGVVKNWKKWLCVLLKKDAAALSANRTDKRTGNTNVTDDANWLFQILWGKLLYMPFLLSLYFFCWHVPSWSPCGFFFFQNPFLLTENVSYPFLTDESKLHKYCAFYNFPLQAVTLI